MTNTKGWQSLMFDEAYKSWSNHAHLPGEVHEKRKSYKEFITGLDTLHRTAVILGNLNYQVENGGFSQWIGNGYAVYAHEVINICQKIDGEQSLKVAEIVQRVLPCINFERPGELIMETCDECDGVGMLEIECQNCDGQGDYYGEEGENYECFSCYGQGTVEKSCGWCDGNGKIPKEDIDFEQCDHDYYSVKEKFGHEVAFYLLKLQGGADEEQAFRYAITSGDHEAREAYHDWLEERGKSTVGILDGSVSYHPNPLTGLFEEVGLLTPDMITQEAARMGRGIK